LLLSGGTYHGIRSFQTLELAATPIVGAPRISGLNEPAISRHYAMHLDALADLKLLPSIGTRHGVRSVEMVR
jgi:hypothetical protein